VQKVAGFVNALKNCNLRKLYSFVELQDFPAFYICELQLFVSVHIIYLHPASIE